MQFSGSSAPGVFQDDWAAWSTFTTKVGGPTQVVGDDLTVSGTGWWEKWGDTMGKTQGKTVGFSVLKMLESLNLGDIDVHRNERER